MAGSQGLPAARSATRFVLPLVGEVTVNAAGMTCTSLGGDLVNEVYFTDPERVWTECS